MKTTLIAALAASCLLAPQCLPAAALADPARTTVSYADLDLQTPAGRAEVLTRIHKAASRLCRDTPEEGEGQLAAQLAFEDCVNRTTQATAAKLPAPSYLAQAGR